MQKKTIAMMVATGCVVGVLTGCGVPQEDHDAMIAQLTAEHKTAVDALNGTLADTESVLKSEQSKARKFRIELDNASETIVDLKKDKAETAKALADAKAKIMKVERDLASAKSRASAAQNSADEAENKVAELEAAKEKLQNRFDQFVKNINMLSSKPEPEAVDGAEMVDDSLTMEEPAEVAEPVSAMSALDILNDMSAK